MKSKLGAVNESKESTNKEGDSSEVKEASPIKRDIFGDNIGGRLNFAKRKKCNVWFEERASVLREYIFRDIKELKKIVKESGTEGSATKYKYLLFFITDLCIQTGISIGNVSKIAFCVCSFLGIDAPLIRRNSIICIINAMKLAIQ